MVAKLLATVQNKKKKILLKHLKPSTMASQISESTTKWRPRTLNIYLGKNSNYFIFFFLPPYQPHFIHKFSTQTSFKLPINLYVLSSLHYPLQPLRDWVLERDAKMCSSKFGWSTKPSLLTICCCYFLVNLESLHHTSTVSENNKFDRWWVSYGWRWWW